MSNVKVVTGKVRLSYCNIFEPRAHNEGDTAKYSTAILIPKSDKETVAKFEKAIKKVIEENKDKLGGKTKGLKTPLRDGDEEREDDPEYAGHYFFNASSTNKPIVLDEDRDPVMDNRKVYSGCYARVSVNLYVFNTNGNRGVAAGLNAVMKVEDGEPLGGVYTENEAAGDFDDDDML